VTDRAEIAEQHGNPAVDGEKLRIAEYRQAERLAWLTNMPMPIAESTDPTSLVIVSN
jgi:hypothetical protein